MSCRCTPPEFATPRSSQGYMFDLGYRRRVPALLSDFCHIPMLEIDQYNRRLHTEARPRADAPHSSTDDGAAISLMVWRALHRVRGSRLLSKLRSFRNSPRHALPPVSLWHFIDGCHYREYVKADTENALRNIRAGGVVVWHDYGDIKDVSRVVDGSARRITVRVVRGTRLAVGWQGVRPIPAGSE